MSTPILGIIFHDPDYNCFDAISFINNLLTMIEKKQEQCLILFEPGILALSSHWFIKMV
jgi:hypothetical protein